MDKDDILSDVLATLRIDGELYFRAVLAGDFSVELPPEHRRIRFHLVRRGRCWIGLSGAPPTPLSEGDLAIVPNGAGQILSAEPGITPRPLPEILATGALANGVLTYGEGDRGATLICGYCRFDEAIDHPLLTNLPALLVLRPADLGAEPWATAALQLLTLEADLDAQGTTGILGRLLEIVFIQAVRRSAATDGRPASGFVAALTDKQLSRALVAVHRAPEKNWTIAGLAAEAGMSRAQFAARFTSIVGMAPIGYLTAWRLTKARALLVTSDLAMIEISERCGYASVPSFSRRFTKAFGMGPGTFRRTAKSV